MRRDCPCAVTGALGARAAPLGCRRDFLGRDDGVQRDHDVGLPRPDSTAAGVAGDQVSQGVGQAAVDPVTHHHARSRRGGGEKTGGGRGGQTHHFILGARLGSRERAGR